MEKLSFSTHPEIHNKPRSGWKPSFAEKWKLESSDLESLRDHILNGGAFVAAAMTSHRRSSAAFDYANLACVDIDNGLKIDDFLKHPLARHSVFAYTTASHNAAENKHRYRVIFQLPQKITDGDLYKAILTMLSKALGGDQACTDACRLFYGNSEGETILWQPSTFLPADLINEAEKEAEKRRTRYDHETKDYDQITIDQAIYCLEQVIEPTSEGDYQRFTKVTAAARAGGSSIYTAWCDWASQGHHGSGNNSRRCTEKFFYGFNGSSLATLFYCANECDSEWRKKLPSELKGSGDFGTDFIGQRFSVSGYDHSDFGGEEEEAEEEVIATPTQSLFSENRPWNIIAPTPPPVTTPPTHHAEEISDEPAVHARNTQNRDGLSEIEIIERHLRLAYPDLRRNAMSLDMEYGSKANPSIIRDVSTTYVKIPTREGRAFPKTLVYDVTTVMADRNEYNPCKAYLEFVASRSTPCNYFDTLASTLIGTPEDIAQNPRMPDGKLLADVIMKRFMIGAVARVLQPGVRHDWMPIFIGGQNCGKSTFFQYLTPPDPTDPGNYPWVSTIQQGIEYLKDRPHALHSGWIVVLDEAERYFKRKHVEELKNLVSVSVDRSARKYENEKNYPRSFVLAGATNGMDFLVDPTGNRRFMPIIVSGKVESKDNPKLKIIDLDRLKADRNSIWAAAYQAYLDEPIHNFSSYELSHIADYIDSFTKDSPLETRIAETLTTHMSGYYKTQGYITLSDLYSWLEIAVDKQAQIGMQVTDALKRLNYKQCRATIDGKTRRIWLRPN